ncbi:MAG: hypothetical protein GF364_01555 [Candidatus Lokiarchaeota archaeon]|nr:hypothetical protein [Candidatus Lokiarchaeota archaeon]
MRPPICAICDKRFAPNEGGLVYFKKRESDKKWYKRAKEEYIIGHPPNAEWFCEDHYVKAKEYENLPLHEALEKLRREFK